jgi:hypothetical protein
MAVGWIGSHMERDEWAGKTEDVVLKQEPETATILNSVSSASLIQHFKVVTRYEQMSDEDASS